MNTDEHPELRCRCVHRRQYPDDLEFISRSPDDYHDRCRSQATAEDGMCGHCRQPVGGCQTCTPVGEWPCCTHPSQQPGRRVLADPRTPCIAYPVEVPF